MKGRNTAGDAMAGSAIHEKWVSTYRTAEAAQFYEMAFDEVVRQLDAPPGSVVLDAGCGSCAKSVLLAARGLRVVGTDFSADALALAAELLRERNLQDQITLRQGDLMKLPFADGEFKYIVCWGVLIHVPDSTQALSELARVLAPGGTLVVSEANMYSMQAVGMRWARRLTGRRRDGVTRTPAGIETREPTGQGTLLTRLSDVRWFVSQCERRGLRLRRRLPGQFTELYSLAPGQMLKRWIHGWNAFWFRRVRSAGPAFGNILVFDKPA